MCGGLPSPWNTSFLQLTVQVEDINDNRPMFSQDEYRTTVTENAALGTTVAIISATDGDSGSNGEVTYGFGTTSSNTLPPIVSSVL